MDIQESKLFNKNLISRLERLESIEEIRALVSGYAESCDQQDLPALENLFTLDAEFDSPNGLSRVKEDRIFWICTKRFS